MNEVYALRLDHYVIDKKMNRYRLEEPMVVQMTLDRRTGITTPYCLNRMLDMMKDEVMKRVGETDD